MAVGPGLGPGLRHGQMGCIVLCRTFQTAPQQGQRPTPIVPHFSGSGVKSGLGPPPVYISPPNFIWSCPIHFYGILEKSCKFPIKNYER